MKRARLTIVETVTREHAEIFANDVVRRLSGDTELHESLDLTEIMAWPEEEDVEALDRFKTIQDEIVEAILLLSKRSIADAFYMAASVILARERER